jgi:hypothetical protein
MVARLYDDIRCTVPNYFCSPMEMVPYPIELYLLYKAVAVELLVLLTFKNIIDVMSNII